MNACLRLWSAMLPLMLAACSSVSPAPLTAVADVPPRMVLGGADGTQRVWDNVGAFRPVPLQLRAKAIEVCEASGARPAGFHPRAMDENGRTFAEGGFYCVKD